MFDRIDVEICFTTIPRFKFGGFDGKDYEKWGHRLSRMLRTLADDLHKFLKARAAGL
jgi:hypothetical protein